MSLTGTPIIIPIFLPHLGCRQQCLFCNQKAVATEVPSPVFVRKSIEAFVKKLLLAQQDREKQVAFYGGSFTAMPQEDQVAYLEAAQPFRESGLIHSVRISTRPDALAEEALYRLKTYGVKTVEIGAQSMIDEVLLLSQRGHGPEETFAAALRLKEWGFTVGIHLMIGLPGDTVGRFLQSLKKVIDLNPDFVRIHPTLVLRGAPLEHVWRAGKYSALSLDETIQWLKKGLLTLDRTDIRVARIGLQPTRDLEKHLLAGPYHAALHQLVDSEIFFDMAERLLQRLPNGRKVCFFCHPKEISNVRGQRNENISKLKEQFQLQEVFVQEAEAISRGSLFLSTAAGSALINRRELIC